MEEAGPELDALIAEKVMDWHHYDSDGDCSSFWLELTDWSPSTDIAAAWQVVEKLAEQAKFICLAMGGWNKESRRWTTWICEVDIAGEGRFEADTAPLAICRAALRTVK